LLPKEEDERPAPKPFKDYEPGFIHVDVKYLPQMPDETERQYLFAAIDRASRWVYVELLGDKSASFGCPRLPETLDRSRSVHHHACPDRQRQGIYRSLLCDRRTPAERRTPLRPDLYPPWHRSLPHQAQTPQTNGMVERFNGRISEVLATHRFDSSKSLKDTILRYARLYNHSIPQRALGHISPIQALKDWQQKRPALFKKHVYNLTGLDS
jgi:hypothetical protein